MSDWIQASLDECTDILDHLRVPVNEEERSRAPGYTPYYGANGLQGFIDGWIFNEPLILLAEDGGYFDQFETRSVAYKITGKSWVNNHAHILRPKEGYDFDFIFYSLEHKNVLPFIRGGTRAKLNQNELRCIKINIPKEVSVQKKISKILQILDQAIEKTEALIHKYQQIKSGLMHDLFNRGLSADGKLRPPREQAPELYQETPIGWVPKAWDCVPVNDLCLQVVDCPHSTPFYQDNGIPCIRTADMVPGQLLLDQAYRVSKIDYLKRIQRLTPKQGDIIYSREGERLGIASPVGEDKVCLGQRVMLLRPGQEVDQNFLLWSMNLPYFYRRVVKGLGATTSPHVNVGDIKNIMTYRPPEKEQVFIGKSIKTVQAKLLTEELYRKKLITQKSGLMHDLLTGKVPVFIDPEETAHGS
ncbi:MAG: restriction endonuclease subunit S [Desulfobacteraceae bacterium]|jgi:type I restriction enzyme S subunit|nr:restriction endonuclease subunit S [Desulfobacteraceae bacterium]